MQMFHRIQDIERFLDSVIFSVESMLHVSGNVNTTVGFGAAKIHMSFLNMFVTAQK
jgi:hypothetical protein